MEIEKAYFDGAEITKVKNEFLLLDIRRKISKRLKNLFQESLD